MAGETRLYCHHCKPPLAFVPHALVAIGHCMTNVPHAWLILCDAESATLHNSKTAFAATASRETRLKRPAGMHASRLNWTVN